MKSIFLVLVATSSFSTFANTDCVSSVMDQALDIPQVAEAVSQQDKNFAIASKYKSVSGQVETAKEQRVFLEKIRAVAKQACSVE